MWPALYGLPEGGTFEGTCYVQPALMGRIIQEEGFRGQGWKFRNEWTTYKPCKVRRYKTLNRLKPRDRGDFHNIMDSCYVAGLDPPTSFTEIFRQCLSGIDGIPPKSPVLVMQGATYGGWEQIFRHRPYMGRVYKYDLNKAYRWAACQGLPDIHTAYYLTRYEDEPYAVYDAEYEPGEVPWWPRKQSRGFITTEEIEACGKVPRRVIQGIAFQHTIDLSPTFAVIDQHFPFCRDRISRAFWGLWNSVEGPEQHSWKFGPNMQEKGNPFYNPVWALYITSRVKMRIQAVRSLALQCYVDAVVTIDPLPVGEAPGEWRLQGEYESYRGVWIGPQEEIRISLAKGEAA